MKSVTTLDMACAYVYARNRQVLKYRGGVECGGRGKRPFLLAPAAVLALTFLQGFLTRAALTHFSSFPFT